MHIVTTGGQQVSSFLEIGYVTCENAKLPVTRKIGLSGKSYWSMKFRIGVAFGGLQIKVNICLEEEYLMLIALLSTGSHRKSRWGIHLVSNLRN